MSEETRSPVQVPTEAPAVSPDEGYEMDPQKLCPNQQQEVTKRIGPLLP